MSDKKFNNNIDLQKFEIKNPVLHKLGTAPLSPVEGLMYWDTATKQMFLYNGSSYVFPGINDLGDLNDTDFSGFVSATDNQYLVYDQATGNWIPKTIVLDLENVGDVSYPAPPTNGQVLTYNTATSKWEPATNPSGGLGINNAGTGRLVLSGATAVANLEGQETLEWDSINQVMKFGATLISHDVKLITVLKTDVGAAIPAGSAISIIGAASYYVGTNEISAGIRITTTENHSPTLLNGTAVVLEFLTTTSSSTAQVVGGQFASNGCFVVGPDDYTTTHEKAGLLINNGEATKMRSIKNADVTIDSTGSFDRHVTVYMDDLTSRNAYLPDPTVDYAGRVIEITSFGINGEELTIETVSTLSKIWYGGIVSQVLMQFTGRTTRFICMSIDGVYYWNTHGFA